MATQNEQLTALRKQLVDLLTGENAHAGPNKVLVSVSPELRGTKAPAFEHTLWQLLEHLRIAQWDILEFSRSVKHESPSWPKGYWPKTAAPPDEDAWDKSVSQFMADLKSMEQLVSSPSTDLFAPIPWGDGQTILREALLLADHNAYHLGQFVLVRKALGDWKS